MRPGCSWAFAVATVLGGGLLYASVAVAAERPRARPDAPEEPQAAATSPVPAAAIEVRFDFDVVERFLSFVDHGGASREELQQWTRLPGNRELLRQGRAEGGLTPEILMEAVRVSLSGQVFTGPPVLGSFTSGDWTTLHSLVDTIRERRGLLGVAAAESLRPYLPVGRSLPPLTVYFHLGGSWDGRTSDAVYINLTLFQARGPEGLAGLDALLVHELFHQAHSYLFPAVEDYSSRQSALYAVLLRLQQEGIARHLECRYLQHLGVDNGLDRTNFAKYMDGLRTASEHIDDLEGVREMLQRNRVVEARMLAGQGFLSGGPLYAIGHRMAETIEAGAGQDALARTVTGGPLVFASAYERAVRGDHAARRGGEASLLTAAMLEDIRQLRHGYGRDPVRASRLRREGLARIESQHLDEAVATLEQATGLDPTDSTSAYNLACAYALSGRTKPALRWLGRAFDRGFTKYKHAALDDDLSRLRDEPEFAAMLRERGFDYRRGAAPGGSAPPPTP